MSKDTEKKAGTPGRRKKEQDDPSGTMALHALGALSPDEARAAQELLLGGSFVCAAELKVYQELLSRISRAVATGAPDPPPELKQKLMDQIEAKSESENSQSEDSAEHIQVWKSWPEEASSGAPGLVVRRAAEGAWQKTAVPGVSVKSLFVDSIRHYVTMLVKMDAGVSYPGHLHDAAEECYVLDGDLQVGDQFLRKGDYQRAAAGSKHGVQSTREGCILLVLSSQNDELLPS